MDGRFRSAAFVCASLALGFAWGAYGQEAAGTESQASLGDPQPPAAVVVANAHANYLYWENDRIAHRIYSHALEATEPPSGSGIDVWAKSVRWPYVERQIARGNYHEDHGEGLDFYDVGGSRGAGGLGIWYDNKLWASRNYQSYRVLQNGPGVASFEVNYAPWPVDIVRRVWETRRFSLPMGTNFTQMTSTIGSNLSTPLTVAIGMAKLPTSRVAGKVMVDREHGRMSVWTEGAAGNGAIGVAIMVDPASVIEFKQDADNYLVLIRALPGKPFIYYTGAAWSKGLDFHSQQEWEDYVRAQQPSFVVAGASHHDKPSKRH